MAQIDQLEHMAAALEAHADYKVLRRMRSDHIEIAAPRGGDTLRVGILDVETTGLQHGRDKIIELGALVVEVDRDTGECLGVIRAYQGFEDPGFAIPEEITAITGITNEVVAGQRLDEERLTTMFEGVALVVAHNAGFDRKFVEARLPMFETLDWACSQTQIDWKAAGIGSAKLDYLASQYGFFYDAHRAQTDCMALLKMLTAPMPTGGGTGLGRLMAQAQQSAMRIWAINSPFDAKDALKARRYSWDPQRRCWHITLRKADLRDEFYWLRDNVYGGDEVVLEFEALSAKVLFSERRGEVARKRVPAVKLAA